MSEEIKPILEDLGKSFHDFKQENDARLTEIEKKGHADPLLQEKVDKLSEEVAKNAELKQTVEMQQKNLDAAEEKLSKLESTLARPETANSENLKI